LKENVAASTAASTAPTSLWSRDFALALAAMSCFFTNYFMLASVAPLVVERASGRVEDAGIATAVFGLFTVVFEFLCPRFMRRFGKRGLLATSMILTGVASLAFILTPQSATLMMVEQALRGVGFGVSAVVGVATLSDMAPPGRHGEAFGYFGLASAAQSTIGPALGLTLLASTGVIPPFLIGGLASAIGGLLVLMMHGQRSAPPPRVGHLSLWKHRRDIIVPAVAFCFFAATNGALISFAPLGLPSQDTGPWLATAASFFFFQALARAFVRWFTAKPAEHGNTKAIMLVALAVATFGLALLTITRGSTLVIVAALIYGATYGTLQNTSYVGMLKRVPREDIGTVAAIWNVVFDGGIGLGGFASGLVVAALGFQTTFLALPALPLVGLVIMLFTRWGDRPAD
jgi:predicted MFS family arabinose efflux permease